MNIPRNPYVAGNPVGNTPAFVGRVDILREVLRVLRRPQDSAVVLYGQRRIGKTSILQELVNWLPRQGSYRPIEFDLQDKATWSLSQVLRELARTIAYTLNEPTPDLGNDPEDSFRTTWLRNTLTKLPVDVSLVILFDEFDVLDSPGMTQAATGLFPYLRNLLSASPPRLKFVFVIGRNINDLSNIALSLFKGTPTIRVSLLSHDDTTNLVRLSDTNRTLHWRNAALTRVWELTNGHPFLTQQICSHVWEQMYDNEPSAPPIVSDAARVESAIATTLDTSRNSLEWLWNGLPPAEKVVVSALAEAGPGIIPQRQLDRILRVSGVRVMIRELQNAPKLLQDWDLIEPADSGYLFRVELLRRWIAEQKPLRRVQETLDQIDPVADSFYRAGLGLYHSNKLEQALAPLRQAIELNPNHAQANQLLADILLALAKPDEARQILERLYEYQPDTARPRLVQSLLTLAQSAESEDLQIPLYEQVLKIEIDQPEAVAGIKRIWAQRGDVAFESGNLTEALQAYRTAGLHNKEVEIEYKLRQNELNEKWQLVIRMEEAGQYQEAWSAAQMLANEYGELKDWRAELERLERKTHIAELYQRALGALQSGDKRNAQSLLAQVVSIDPTYGDGETTRYLHLVATGVDVGELQSKLRELQSKLDIANDQVVALNRSANAPRETTTEKPTARRLELWNPLDPLLLLWWVLVEPQSFLEHQRTFGAKEHTNVSRWLASTLIWLPLFIPLLTLGLRASSTTYLMLCFGLFVAWILTGRLKEDHNLLLLSLSIILTTTLGTLTGAVLEEDTVLLATVCFIEGVVLAIPTTVLGGFRFATVLFLVIFGIPFGAFFGGPLGVISSIGAVATIALSVLAAFGIISFARKIVSEQNATRVTVATIALVFFEFLFAVGIAYGAVFGGWGCAMSILMLPTLAASVFTTDECLKTGKPSWLARTTFITLIITYTLLISLGFFRR